MTCWHIHRPMTPVPIQPTRVLPGSTLVTGMAPPSRLLAPVATTHPGNLDDLAERGADGKCDVFAVSPSAAHHKISNKAPTPTAESRSMIVPRLRAPIVLVHGLFGFDRLRLGPWVQVDYF